MQGDQIGSLTLTLVLKGEKAGLKFRVRGFSEVCGTDWKRGDQGLWGQGHWGEEMEGNTCHCVFQCFLDNFPNLNVFYHVCLQYLKLIEQYRK